MIEIESVERSKKMSRRNVQMPPVLWTALEEYAKDRYKTVPDVIRQLVVDELQKTNYIKIGGKANA